MAEQLSTSKPAFDPFGNVFALPEGWEPPEEESDFDDEPVELEEEFQTPEEIAEKVQSEDLSALDTTSEDTDLLGDFVIKPADEFDPEERSYTVPSKEEETKDEKLEGITQFEDLKEKSMKKLGGVGEEIVEFGKKVGNMV